MFSSFVKLASKNIFQYKALLLFILIPSISFAQDLPERYTVEDVNPSTGSLMAAAFETAGYVAQSQVLDHLGFMFESFGALLYIIVLISGVVSFTIYGSYQNASWLLIGPVLFFFLINTRQVGYGAEWQWGYKDSTTTAEFAEAIGGIRNNEGKIINRVSWFFDEYNKLVSDFIQQSIKIVLRSDVHERIKPMARQGMLAYMFNADIQSPNIKTLIQYHQAYCSEEMEYFRQIALGKRHKAHRTSTYYRSIVEVDQFKRKKMTISPGQPVYDALEDIFKGYHESENLAETEDGFNLGEAYQQCSVPQKVPSGISCEQVWCWMVKGLQVEVLPIIEAAEEQHLPQAEDSATQETKNENEAFKKQIWQDILVKLSDPKTIPVGDDNDYNTNLVEGEELNLALIPVIIGGHLMRKEMALSGNSSFMSQLGENSGYRNDPFNLELNKISMAELEEIIMRYQRDQLRAVEQGKVYTLALYMPYVQGLVLYILSLTFPFFALMVLIPGQTQSFMQWLGLWFWVKLWDLGWALVIVLDEILWSMMPHSAHYDVLSDPNDTPITYFDTAFSADPTYTLGMYYTIMGVVISAVPVVSAQLFLGAKMAVVNALTQGMSQVASKWGGSFKNAVATSAAMNLEKLRMDFALNNGMNQGSSASVQRIDDAADLAAEYADKLSGTAALAMAGFLGSMASLASVKGGLKGLKAGGGNLAGKASEIKEALKSAVKSGNIGEVRKQMKEAGKLTDKFGKYGVHAGKSGAALNFFETAKHIHQNSLNLGRHATALRASAFKLHEYERLASSGRTTTDLNLQGLLGATRSRIGHWFSRGSESQSVNTANKAVHTTAALIQIELANATSKSAERVIDQLDLHKRSKDLQDSALKKIKEIY